MTGVEATAGDRSTPSGAVTGGSDGDGGPEIGWLRAIVSGLVILGVALGAGVIGANLVLTRATGVGRGAREGIGSGVFLAVVLAVAWAQRRLQARGLI